jgi:pimeloyl-ACP methyl ester carboxylesterase
MPRVELPQGTLHYRDEGKGPVVVLVHGLLVNGTLWSRVQPLLAGCRVLIPDLPLGSHPTPMRPDADLTPAGLARLIADFLAALDLADVTLVGNDTGGALCQITAADHPERLGRLVLTNCDAYRNFLPPTLRPLQLLPRIPGAMWALAKGAHLAPVRAATGMLTSEPVPPDLFAGWVEPIQTSPGVRRDVAKVLRGITTRETMRAIEILRGFDRPALIVWGREDRFFAPKFAEQLAADIPGARLEWLPDARTFTPLDAPEQLAALITEFTTAKGALRAVGDEADSEQRR